MKDKIRESKILEVRGTRRKALKDLLARESPVTIFLNDVDLVTLLCTPCDLENLAVGFLFSEGLLKGPQDIKKVFADKRDGAVWIETYAGKRPSRKAISKRLITTGCGKRLSFADMGKGLRKLDRDGRPKLSPDYVAEVMKRFQRASNAYLLTGGVHSAALADERGTLYFGEDIGRHNAADKVIGQCLIDRGDLEKLVLITSGRISSDILAKAARGRIPVIMSRAAPTDLAVRLARALNITLIGFARGHGMNIYSGEWRVTIQGPGRERKHS